MLQLSNVNTTEIAKPTGNKHNVPARLRGTSKNQLQHDGNKGERGNTKTTTTSSKRKWRKNPALVLGYLFLAGWIHSKFAKLVGTTYCRIKLEVVAGRRDQ
jgi:hypothetical protein